jgi:hypothetical protein
MAVQGEEKNISLEKRDTAILSLISMYDGKRGTDRIDTIQSIYLTRGQADHTDFHRNNPD